MGLSPTSLSIEGILGVDDLSEKINLALNAELLSRFISRAGKAYCPTQMVNMTLKTVAINEPGADFLRAILT